MFTHLQESWKSSIEVLFLSLAQTKLYKYRTRAIITRGSHNLNPLFKGQKRFFKEVFSENSVSAYCYYSTAVCNQERVKMADVWLIFFLNLSKSHDSKAK